MFQKFKEAFFGKLLFATVLMSSATAHALTKVDLTTDASGGKTLTDVFTNADNTAQEGAAFLIGIAAIAGYLIIVFSIWTLYKAGKDEREKPMSAIIGLFLGPILAGVGTFMWIARNSILGS